jgi:hypothetical protein
MKVKILSIDTINLYPENDAEMAILSEWKDENIEIGGYSTGTGITSLQIRIKESRKN